MADSQKKTPSHPAGRTPHDPVNGMRVGAFAGGILGAIVMWAFGVAQPWLLVIGAGLGGAVGYFTEKRKLTR